jgi:hypothetical protein
MSEYYTPLQYRAIGLAGTRLSWPLACDPGDAHVAALTRLEDKIGEVIGLAMAAQVATKLVLELTRELDPALADRLEEMREDAAETEGRASELADTLNGKKPAILERAHAVRAKSIGMLTSYLDSDSDALDGFEFLTMSVAAEVAHWSVLTQFNVRVEHEDLADLIAWAVPTQTRHLQLVLEGSRELAAEFDPDTLV